MKYWKIEKASKDVLKKLMKRLNIQMYAAIVIWVLSIVFCIVVHPLIGLVAIPTIIIASNSARDFTLIENIVLYREEDELKVEDSENEE